MLPAIIIVAPNSPSALANVSIRPDRSPGIDRGTKSLQKILVFDIPKVLAANKMSSSTCSKAPRLVLYIMGRLTTVADITAASGVKIIFKPKLASIFPNIEFFPNIMSRKKPTTVGGRTMDSVKRPSTKALPLFIFITIYANAMPRKKLIALANKAVMREINNGLMLLLCQIHIFQILSWHLLILNNQGIFLQVLCF